MEKPPEVQTGVNQNAFPNKVASQVHKFYIAGEIKSPSEYTAWFETIRHSGENDLVVLHINSYGGDLFTAIQFMRVIAETKAMVVASVEGACMSAATVIFLSAKSWEISKHSMFMFHNYSTGSFGKGGELYDNIIHERKWSEKLWKDVYTDFLTDEEIKSILNNKDIWMSAEEVTKRLTVKAEKMNREKLKAEKPEKKTAKKTAKKTSK